jgi:hypothetical protein
LISRYIPAATEQTRKVGIVPHYVDRDIVLADSELSLHYIDIMSGVENVIREITSCEYIISSALHGVICAEAYGIPALYVEFSDSVAGHGFKFEDYYLGTSRPPRPAVNWRTHRNVAHAIKLLETSWQPPRFNYRKMLALCPFTYGFTDYKRWNELSQITENERNSRIAKLIESNARVIEFGAGGQSLKPLLKNTCKYTPSDILPRTPDTVVCDINTRIFPSLSKYDTVVMSGVLEYIYPEVLETFLSHLYSFPRVKTIICSYEHGGHEYMRSFNGWTNNYSVQELENLFLKHGYKLQYSKKRVYKFVRQPA